MWHLRLTTDRVRRFSIFPFAFALGIGTPYAALAANEMCLAPLKVDFDGEESTDPDGIAIAEYTFNFGDGTPAVTQSAPEISHVYAAPGAYPATLKIKNAQGAESTNVDRVLINVNGVAVQVPETKRFGGALGLGLLLPAVGLALLRRRRR